MFMRLRGIQIDIHHGYTSQSILRKSLSILTRHFPYYFVVWTRAALSASKWIRTIIILSLYFNQGSFREH